MQQIIQASQILIDCPGMMAAIFQKISHGFFM